MEGHCPVGTMYSRRDRDDSGEAGSRRKFRKFREGKRVGVRGNGSSPYITPLLGWSDYTSRAEWKFSEADGTDTTWCSWVVLVKNFDKSRSIDVGFVDPGIFFVTIAFPGNEELKFPTVNPAVKDVVEFVL